MGLSVVSMSKRMRRRRKVRISHKRIIRINKEDHNHNRKVRNLARMLSIDIMRLFMMVRRYSSTFSRRRNKTKTVS